MSKSLVEYFSGMGDHLICNGLVREHAKRHSQVCLYSNNMYHEAVSFMYRDLPNVRVHNLDIRHKPLARNLSICGHQLTGSTHFPLHADEEDGIVWEHLYYAIAQVPLEKKWLSFHVERDAAREKALFEKVSPQKPFIFLHEDNRFHLDPKHIPSNFSVVRPMPGLTTNIFDWSLLIEQAEEVHAISSSFMYLADLLPYQHPGQKLVMHLYARPTPLNRYPLVQKPWTILE